jgi:hypothetical protein
MAEPTMTELDATALRRAFDRAEDAGYDGLGLCAQQLVQELLSGAESLGEQYFCGTDDHVRWGYLLKGICDRRTLLTRDQLTSFYDTYIDYWAVVHETPLPKMPTPSGRKEERDFKELLLENVVGLNAAQRESFFRGYLGSEVVDLKTLEHVTGRWVEAKRRLLLRQRTGRSQTSAIANAR